MKKILCLVDSSAYMNQHIQFVGSLAKDIVAKVYLISVATHSKHAVVSSSSHDRLEHLDEWHDYLSGIRHISTEIESAEIMDSPYQKLNELGEHYDLMTMSLNSTESKMTAGGLSLTRVLNEIHKPVLLVPSEITRWEIKRLVYVFDFKQDTSEWLVRLGELADWFRCDIKIYILQNGDLSIHEENKRNSVFNKFTETRRGRNNIVLETTSFITQRQFEKSYTPEYGDLPVLRVYPAGLIERLFGKDDLRNVIRKNSNPFLIVH